MKLYHRDASFRAEADRWLAMSKSQAVAAEGGMHYSKARGIDEALSVTLPGMGKITEKTGTQ